MITVLVRTSYRPELFKRLYESLKAQTFTEWRMIVSYDDDRALTYIPNEIEKIRVHKTADPFFYDHYINVLKSQVTYGYFVAIDDDEVLLDHTALHQVWEHLKGSDGLVCQFSRSGRLKPSNELIAAKKIVRGKIGMPCLFLHWSKKDVAFLDGSRGAADYKWINEVSIKVKLKFVPIVVAYCDRRSNGVMEV